MTKVLCDGLVSSVFADFLYSYTLPFGVSSNYFFRLIRTISQHIDIEQGRDGYILDSGDSSLDPLEYLKKKIDKVEKDIRYRLKSNRVKPCDMEGSKRLLKLLSLARHNEAVVQEFLERFTELEIDYVDAVKILNKKLDIKEIEEIVGRHQVLIPLYGDFAHEICDGIIVTDEMYSEMANLGIVLKTGSQVTDPRAVSLLSVQVTEL